MNTTQPRPSSRSHTVADLLPQAAATFGPHVAIRHKHEDTWTDISFAQLAERAGAVARGLMALGIRPGDRVCVLGTTRPEWTTTALGVAMAGATLVPIYPSSSSDECRWVISHSGAEVVVCEGPAELARVFPLMADLPNVRRLLSFDSADGATRIDDLDPCGVSEEALAKRWSAVTPNQPFAIVYTSGTTGPPKGCVHSHGGYRAALDTIRARDALHGPEDLLYLFLPLAHVFALMIQLAALDVGTPVAYVSGDVRRVVPDLAEVRPTFLPSVPRIFEKLYATVSAQMSADQVAEVTRVGMSAREHLQSGTALPEELAARFGELDATLFAKVRATFGGRLREAASGAAPIARNILEFFYAAGVPVMEGWGLTETAVAVTTSSVDHHRFGTVGRAVPGVELRLADDGEVLVRGPNIFAGYLDDPEATASTLVDRWLCTGDLGSIDADGYLTITGRKKDIIITAGGKNIAPAQLEDAMRECRWVARAVLHGDARPYLVVLVTLDADELLPWAEQSGLPADMTALSRHPRVCELVQAHLDDVNARYAPVAQAKKLAILDHDFSPESGELTPTLKVKRNVVSERYRDVIDALYDS